MDLHYSRSKLIRLALLCFVFTALALWLAISAWAEPEGHGRGVGAALTRLLGPGGLQMIGWAMAAATALLGVLYLRRAFADPVAAQADAEGVTIRTLFGSRSYAASQIERLELRHIAGQAILQIIPAAASGRPQGLAVNGLAESEGEVEVWIAAAAKEIGR